MTGGPRVMLRPTAGCRFSSRCAVTPPRLGAGPQTTNLVRARRARLLVDDNNCSYTVIMVRTQISLSEEEYSAAKREAERLGISLAELLRRSLRTIVPVNDAKPWMRYAGMGETGDPASSQHNDEGAYGRKD